MCDRKGLLSENRGRSAEEEISSPIREGRPPLKAILSGATSLWLERHKNRPLLIVETKRPKASLPIIARSKKSGKEPELLLSEIISLGLKGTPLGREWSRWLVDLKDYVQSVHSNAGDAPSRVVLTNGDWLVLFLDPADAFLETGGQNADKIIVYCDENEVEDKYADIYRHLAYQNVSGEVSEVTPGEISFHVAGSDVDRILHGVRVLYIN